MKSDRRTPWRMVLLAAVLACSVSGFAIAADDNHDIIVLSNRADLISGGDALVEVIVSPGIRQAMRGGGKVEIRGFLDGAPLPDDTFALRPNGRVQGLVTGLRVGQNVLRVQTPGKSMQIVITNHPIGGAIFSGPQVQPWPCTTQANGLGPAIDAQCNAPTRYKFFYMDVSTEATIMTPWARFGGRPFTPYDLDNPPPAARIAMTTTDQGKTVPYIVRLETGTANRGIHDIAVLFDPSQPWKPWAPQAGWNGKLQWLFGCGASANYGQATQRVCGVDPGPPEEQVLVDRALSRGFAVAASTQSAINNDMNSVVMSETMMMLKEHIEETYGPIRYTIGFGGSGAAMSQHMIANQYPGLLDGIVPASSFPDPWSLFTVNSIDCPLLNTYFDKLSPQLWSIVAQRDAVYGFGVGHPGESGTAQCHAFGGAGFGVAFSPPYAPSSLWVPQRACVPQDQVYDPQSNPAGVRCSVQDYMVNVFGRRPPSAWGPVEQQIVQGFANRFVDRVGVQYGLKALEDGAITPEQFVDLNEKVGGWDIDGKWQPQRTEADPEGVRTMYRSGQVVEGRQLANVAIIDFRSDRRGDVHSNLQAAITRERLLKANGTTANRAEWIGPQGDNTRLLYEVSFLVMDEWLARIEADHSNLPLAQKIIRNRPASAADGCFALGERVDASVCSEYALDSDPTLVAGMPETRDVLKCQLKPLQRFDYNVDVVFTDAQWTRLNAVFPTGVCDWSKPGVGQGPNLPWLSYADGPGGKLLGAEPKAEHVRGD